MEESAVDYLEEIAVHVLEHLQERKEFVYHHRQLLHPHHYCCTQIAVRKGVRAAMSIG